MSKFGDVVVVSINHRLNILGYLDLSPSATNIATPPTPATRIWLRRCAGFAATSSLSAATRRMSPSFWPVGRRHEGLDADADPRGRRPLPEGVSFRAAWSMVSWRMRTHTTQIIDAMLDQLGLDRDQVDQLTSMPYAPAGPGV